MDHIADEMNMEKVDVRLVNLIKPEQIPYKMVRAEQLTQVICLLY